MVTEYTIRYLNKKDGVIYFKHLNTYDKYLKELETLKKDNESLYETL